MKSNILTSSFDHANVSREERYRRGCAACSKCVAGNRPQRLERQKQFSGTSFPENSSLRSVLENELLERFVQWAFDACNVPKSLTFGERDKILLQVSRRDQENDRAAVHLHGDLYSFCARNRTVFVFDSVDDGNMKLLFSFNKCAQIAFNLEFMPCRAKRDLNKVPDFRNVVFMGQASELARIVDCLGPDDQKVTGFGDI